MKRLFTMMLLLSSTMLGLFAANVKVTMNAVSTTMSLANKATSESVAVGEPTNKVYTFEAPAGTYVLTAYGTKNNTVNGTIEIELKDGVDNEFTILTCTAYASNSGWVEGTDYTFSVDVNTREGQKQVVTVGNSITAGRKTFLALNGNSYYATFTPSEAHQAEGYMALYKGGTLTANVNVYGAIPTGADYTVTLPTTAEFYLGMKFAHFTSFTKMEPTKTETVGDVKKLTYRLANGQCYNYRTWKKNELTQAGYFYMNSDEAKRPTLTFTDADYKAFEPKTVKHDVQWNGGYETGDILVNINERGHLKMNVGDKYDAHAMRSWELTDNSTNNYFMEPDFHYTVVNVDGTPSTGVIEIENGDTGVDPWSTIKAVGKGTAIVLVTYDAIGLNYYSSGKTEKTSYMGGEFWSAIWPENTAAYVVTVGEGEAAIEPNMVVNEAYNLDTKKVAGKYVDAEHDVFYYLNTEAGYSYTFKPTGVANVEIAYPVIGEQMASYKGFATTGVTKNEDGSYTVLLKEGRQIVRLTDASGNAVYQVMTAKACQREITNVSRPESKVIVPGDKIKIQYSGLRHPANKMAGIYNMSAYVTYNGVPNGSSLILGSGQYTFGSAASAQAVTIEIPMDQKEDIVMNDGVIQVNGYGDPIGNHRFISRLAGRSANFTAVAHKTYFGAIPEVKIPVTVINKEVTINVTPSTATVVVKDPKGNVVAPAENGKYQFGLGTYTYVATATGYEVLRGSLTLTEDSDDKTTVDLSLVALTEKAWDGTQTTEPAQVDGVYQISTGAELAWLANSVNQGNAKVNAVLTDDINLGGFNWIPIGTSSKKFQGTLNGNGHAIKGLYVEAQSSYQGLFGYIDAATVTGVSIYGEVHGTQFVGGLAGHANGASVIDRIANYANVTASLSSSYVAGIVGRVYTATAKLTNCLNQGTITGTNYVGGILNYYTTAANVTVTNVYNTGKIVGTQTGAIRGLATATATTGTNITNAFANKAYFNETKTTLVTDEQMASGEVAYKLGDAFGQKIGVDEAPVLGGVKVLYDEATGTYSNPENTLLSAGNYTVSAKVKATKSTVPAEFEKYLANDGNYKAKGTLTGDKYELTINTDEGLLNGFSIVADAIEYNASKSFTVTGSERVFTISSIDGTEKTGKIQFVAGENGSVKAEGCGVIYNGILVGTITDIVISPVVEVADFEDNDEIKVDATTGLYAPGSSEQPVTYWNSGSYTFATYCDDCGSYGKYYYDIVVTNSTSAEYKTTADQYNSSIGKAKSGKNYAVWYSNWYGNEKVYFPFAQKISGFYVTNTAWVESAIINGDGMSSEKDGSVGKPFANGDKFTLTVTGYDEDNKETGKVEYTLAECQSGTLRYVKDWRWVDLTSLSEKTISVGFSLNSTKANSYGATTPLYFCIDDFGGVAPETDAPMTEITSTGIQNISSAAVNAERFDIMGRKAVNGKGVQIIRMSDGTVRKTLVK